MKKTLLPFYLMLIFIIAGGLAVGGGLGCGSDGTDPIPTPTPTPVPTPTPSPPAVGDLVMGDIDSDRVFIYYDVLNQLENPALKFETLLGPNPDVILDNATSMIAKPRTLDVANDMLFVGNLDDDTVTIYKGFLSLTNNQAPDVTLDSGGSGIDKPSDLQVFNNDLYVANQDDDTVTIYRDVSTLSDGDAPDVTLDNGGSGVDEPIGLAVANNILYVCNEQGDGMGGSSPNSGTVTIYNDVSTLADGDAPDVILDNATSLLDAPRRCFVIDNILYVSTDDNGPRGGVLSFSPADALLNGQVPNFAIVGSGLVDDPLSVEVCGGRLWIGQADDPGIIGFNSVSSPAFFPDVVVGPPPRENVPPIEDVDEIACFDNTLWGASEELGAIFGYLDPASMVSQQFPDVILSNAGMSSPKALIVVPRP